MEHAVFGTALLPGTEVLAKGFVSVCRKQYDIEINRLTLQIHYSHCYQYREGALKPRSRMVPWNQLCIDQRNTTAKLYQAVIEVQLYTSTAK